MIRWRAAFRLGLLCLLAVLGLSLIAEFSAPGIAVQQDAQRRAMLASVLGDARQLDDPVSAPLQVQSTDLGSGIKQVWRAGRAQHIEALVLEASTEDGYNGRIDVLIGLRLPDATRRHSEVLAVRVIAHHETPGLGDGIERERNPWIDQFVAKSLSMPGPAQWAVQREGGAFDTLAGATISSRALIELTARVLRFVDQHADDLRDAEGGSHREYVDAE